MKNNTVRGSVLSFLWIVFNVPGAWAGDSVQTEIPIELEAQYSEAVVAYQSGEAKKALSLLEPVLKASPKNLKAMELQGLALKSSEAWVDATRVFLKLRKLAQGTDIETETAMSYEFQIGTLLVQLQKFDKAGPFLTKCLRNGFNLPVTKFYLGIVAMEANNYRDAQSHFRSVVRSDVESLKAPSHFYLGVIAKRRKEDTLAESNFKTAKELAEKTSRDPASAPATREGARQLMANVDTLLAIPQQQAGGSAFFASIGLLGGYDTNVLLNPSVDVGATGQSSPTTTFRYNLGYATRIGRVQLVPVWQGSINYNFANETKAGQFFSNDWNLWSTLERGPWRYGVRAGASLILRNFVDTGATTGILKTQSFSPTIGPNIRYSWGDRHAVGTELVYAANSFFNEESLGTELQKSGWEIRWRNYYQDSDRNGWWNPTVELNVQYQYTEGTEFRSIGTRSFASTTRYWNDKLNSSLRAGLGYVMYPDRSTGTRSDIELTAGLQTAYDFSQALRLTGDFSYLNNVSNVTSIYSYSKWVGSVAADYQF
jgi:tetratricopeptide (TPR) repeat protein